MSSSRFSRRSVIKAAGAGAFVAPFASRFVRSAHAAPPKRFILFWHANGAPRTGEWESLLEPLTRADLTLVRKANFPNGDHQLGMPFSTTGRSVKIDDAGKAGGPSIDILISKASGKPPLLLTGKGKPQNYRGWVSYDEAHNVVLSTENPRDAYISVFGKDPGGPGLVTTPGPTFPDLEAAILKAAKEDATEAVRGLPPVPAMPTEAVLKAAAGERGKLNTHFSALTNVEQLVAASAATVAGAGATCGERDRIASSFKEPESYWLVEERLKLHVELIVASFLCDVTRTATLMVTPGGHDEMDFGYLGVRDVQGRSIDPHNNVAHHVMNQTHGARYTRMMRAIKTWDMRHLAYLIKRLKETKEPGGPGTLFDSTVILSTTEMGYSNHGGGEVPVFLSGGLVRRGGELTLTGKSSEYGQLLLAVAHAAGAPLPSFAGATVPLPGVMA